MLSRFGKVKAVHTIEPDGAEHCYTGPQMNFFFQAIGLPSYQPNE